MLDPTAKQKLLVQWPWLEMRQRELMQEAALLDAEWLRLQPSIETGINRYIDEYWDIDSAESDLRSDVSAYYARCSGSVPADELPERQRECAGLYESLHDRDIKLAERMGRNGELLRAEVNAPISSFNASASAIDPKLSHWLSVLNAFLTKADAALGSNQSQNAFITYLQKKYKLDDCQREFIHRQISKQRMTDEEIEELAAELAATNSYRCSPRDQQ